MTMYMHIRIIHIHQTCIGQSSMTLFIRQHPLRIYENHPDNEHASDVTVICMRLRMPEYKCKLNALVEYCQWPCKTKA
jgi:hypothetical protein